MDDCVTATLDLIVEYYDLLGLTLADVMGKNPDKIFPLLKGDHSHTDDLKHIADALDLQAKAIKATGNHPGLAHVHALKFYSMAHSLNSFVRVGQELVDDFVEQHDYIGARDVIERNLMPTILGLKLAGRVIPSAASMPSSLPIAAPSRRPRPRWLACCRMRVGSSHADERSCRISAHLSLS